MKVIGFIFCVLFSCSISAEPTWHESKIDKIYPQGDGSVVLIFKNNNNECSHNKETKYYYIKVNQNGVNETGLNNMYSAALTAAASGMVVTVNFESDSKACYINRLSIQFNN